MKFLFTKSLHVLAVKMRSFFKSSPRSRGQRLNGKSLANPRSYFQFARLLYFQLAQLSGVDHPTQRDLLKKLRAGKKIVVISGAGISVNAGDTWICLRDIVD